MKHWSFNLSLLKNLTTKDTKAMIELFNFSYFENKSSQKNNMCSCLQFIINLNNVFNLLFLLWLK
ncbi:hypothetical protein A0O34_06030 [Chryseobacterium glaciei]|uniref:Uncharacterized protein n=1 Tax=Chryseobacterium glaciei TaxID=1685010 RepID=A0A172XT21_9FLAO|nr:hypothetical protein A0O34_06030 [Chryseobacterium glaciei]